MASWGSILLNSCFIPFLLPSCEVTNENSRLPAVLTRAVICISFFFFFSRILLCALIPPNYGALSWRRSSERTNKKERLKLCLLYAEEMDQRQRNMITWRLSFYSVQSKNRRTCCIFLNPVYAQQLLLKN